MKLSLMDRLGVITSLPIRGSALQLKLARDITDKAAPTEKERKDYDIVDSDGKISWNDSGKESMVDIDFTGSETAFIQGILKDLDDKEKLTAGMLPLYDKFT